jgi:mannose-6-phosphate isomerase-like protein (cupin superfamily)
MLKATIMWPLCQARPMGNDRRLVGPRDARIRFLRTAAETEGALVELETVLPPGTKGPPLHIHLRERESFWVMDGELAIRSDRYWRLYGAGESAVVEPGTPHTFANKSGAPATFVVRIEPPDPFETMIRIGLASKTMPLLRLAEVHHGDDATLMLAKAPVFAQRMVWNGLAGIARIVHRQ